MDFIKNEYGEIRPYTTKDGSIIRELMHPDVHGNGRMSMAEAIVVPGQQTKKHYHQRSEEIYMILEGTGTMEIEKTEVRLVEGSIVAIGKGKAHKVKNDGDEDLKIVCFCCPEYRHEDTFIL